MKNPNPVTEWIPQGRASIRGLLVRRWTNLRDHPNTLAIMTLHAGWINPRNECSYRLYREATFLNASIQLKNRSTALRFLESSGSNQNGLPRFGCFRDLRLTGILLLILRLRL